MLTRPTIEHLYRVYRKLQFCLWVKVGQQLQSAFLKLKEVLTAAETQETGTEGSGLWFTLIKTEIKTEQMFIMPKSTEMIKRKYIHRGKETRWLCEWIKLKKKLSYKDMSILWLYLIQPKIEQLSFWCRLMFKNWTNYKTFTVQLDFTTVFGFKWLRRD